MGYTENVAHKIYWNLQEEEKEAYSWCDVNPWGFRLTGRQEVPFWNRTKPKFSRSASALNQRALCNN